MTSTVTRVAAVGDLHCTRASQGAFQTLFVRIAQSAELLLLAGDLTDRGLPDEARVLIRELAVVRIPCIGVLGNHDFESDAQESLCEILASAGVTVLDGDACEVQRIGIAGVKGFAGGFGQHALGSWGERVTKQFVNEAVQEALKLETALARLRTAHRIALLHYSPVRQTVEGEPPETHPFVGSSRLEEPLSRYPVNAVFHGHAHNGRLEGVTAGGVPVYNVSLPLLARMFPDSPFRVIELPVERAHAAQGDVRGDQ